MSGETPLERILRIQAESDPDEPQTIREWLEANPHMRSTTYVRDTLATLARRTLDGEDFFFALREWLDDLYGAFELPERQAMLDERPPDLGDPRLDAFLGALAEHFAAAYDLRRPDWSIEPHRFLDHLWFVAKEPGFRPLAVTESPAAFRRRGIFIAASLLWRM
ncbi:MAG: hypothetical protein ACRDZO_11520 [Egibacteraceae bacterium]